MLVSFSVENFRSFREQEVLSLVASPRLAGSHADHALPIPDSDEKVLRVAAIYGANGAGKSNIFKALRFFNRLAIRAAPKSSGTGRTRFKFADTESNPSKFDLQFIVDDKLYNYGFAAGDSFIEEEWLTQIVRGKENVLYERATDHEGKVKIEAPGFTKMGEKLAALVTIGGPANQTFLATIFATLQPADRGPEFAGIYKWFRDRLRLIGPESNVPNMAQLLSTDEAFRVFASTFLRHSSTGVDDINVSRSEITKEELSTLLPQQVYTDIISELADLNDKSSMRVTGAGNDMVISKKGGTEKFERVNLQAVHAAPTGHVGKLDMAEESDGTRRLLELLPALYHLRKSQGIFFVDEIDRSLHPNLIWRFVDQFLKTCIGARGQLLFTTHDCNLLDLELLRRDEIWFAEKDQNLATRLYSLSDYKVRTDLYVSKHYLAGRFGAVPFLGNIDGIVDALDGAK